MVNAARAIQYDPQVVLDPKINQALTRVVETIKKTESELNIVSKLLDPSSHILDGCPAAQISAKTLPESFENMVARDNQIRAFLHAPPISPEYYPPWMREPNPPMHYWKFYTNGSANGNWLGMIVEGDRTNGPELAISSAIWTYIYEHDSTLREPLYLPNPVRELAFKEAIANLHTLLDIIDRTMTRKLPVLNENDKWILANPIPMILGSTNVIGTMASDSEATIKGPILVGYFPEKSHLLHMNCIILGSSAHASMLRNNLILKFGYDLIGIKRYTVSKEDNPKFGL
jgi:hypothetical protein